MRLLHFFTKSQWCVVNGVDQLPSLALLEPPIYYQIFNIYHNIIYQHLIIKISFYSVCNNTNGLII